MSSRKDYLKLLDEFKKKTAFNEKLGLDDRDNTILFLIQKNPKISQEDIAKKVKLSQPSVGARIRKLQEKGILRNINGVNFKVVDLSLAKVDINATDTAAVIKEFEHCPFFINGLITSGKYNLCLFFTATDLKRLEGIVNHHLRGNPKVKEVEMNIVISSVKDLVLPLNLDYDDKIQVTHDQKCLNVIK